MNRDVLTWDLDPVIFWITDAIPIKYYGLLFATGLMLGYLIVSRIYRKEGIPLEQLHPLLTYVFLGMFIGARLGHFLFYQPDYLWNHPLEVILPIQKIGDSYEFIGYQGLASHGGTMGVFIALVLYCRKFKVNLLGLLDRISIAVPIPCAFIRFGNFMNSEIYGEPTNGNWGVIFAQDDLIARHPTQLYEAFSYLLIFVILYFIYNSKKWKVGRGQIFGLFLSLLFLARFIVEFFKENQVSFENSMMLNMGQILSIPLVITGLILVLRERRKPMSPGA